MRYIRWFKDVGMKDVALVGGKNASLGQMITHFSSDKMRIPDGFAITVDAYWYILKENKLIDPIMRMLDALELNDQQDLARVGAAVRDCIVSAQLPDDLKQEIADAYIELSKHYNTTDLDVAVRSSATAEDLPNASFAGQQETFLHISGIEKLWAAVMRSMASLFTDRAIVYRQKQGYSHRAVGLSVGVQKMVRADSGSSGVAFSLDTETGCKDVVLINASYGLGEAIVQGLVTPDEYMVHKPTLIKGFMPIIKKQRGDKRRAIVYASDTDHGETSVVDIPEEKQYAFALTDADILELAHAVIDIESYCSAMADHWVPVDVEWAKDGIDTKLYIVQSRPETIYGVHAAEKQIPSYTVYHCMHTDALNILLQGTSVGSNIVHGTVRLINDVNQIDRIQKGDILVTSMTSPDWGPVFGRVAGIITQQGSRTCHAAIVSRELGINAVIGAERAMELLHDGQLVTLDCSQGSVGFVYDTFVPFDVQTISYEEIPEPPVSILVNIADPRMALHTARLPVDGVGLARIEFIITNSIKVHPLALLHPEAIGDKKIYDAIDHITAGYTDKVQFFIDTLAYGIGMIAAAFYPRSVIVRTSDFKTNEYRNLVGGIYFEPQEENPMLGLRGAARYYHEKYTAVFTLECTAIRKVRNQMGLKNVKVMIPFIRTVQEAAQITKLMNQHGLKRGEDGLEFLMMCELPSNVILIDQFVPYFDGFSIGSNDLTQLILGIDRDSALLKTLFDERNEAVKRACAHAIQGAHKAGCYIGVCGQATSDYPEFAAFLIEQKIDSISLNADTVLPFIMSYKK